MTEMNLASPAMPRGKMVTASNNAVADVLNVILADCFVLYIKTKNFHWHVSGPNFRELHLLFDEQANQIFAVTDAIAERVRKLGARTLGSIGDIARHQTVRDDDLTDASPMSMVATLRDDNHALISALKDAKRRADDAGDNATSGLIDVWTDEAEQRVWFLSETAR